MLSLGLAPRDYEVLKVVVAGPAGAGKRTFVRFVCKGQPGDERFVYFPREFRKLVITLLCCLKFGLSCLVPTDIRKLLVARTHELILSEGPGHKFKLVFSVLGYPTSDEIKRDREAKIASGETGYWKDIESRYATTAASYFRAAHAIVICVDPTSKTAEQDLKMEVLQWERRGPDVPPLIICTKSDLHATNSFDPALPRVSSLTGENVENVLFRFLQPFAEEVARKRDAVSVASKNEEKRKESSCVVV
jgi:GTPase SAR1 family protein